MGKNYFTTPNFTQGIISAEIATPATPSSGFVWLYAKSDHKIYIKDSTGIETDITTSSGGVSDGDKGDVTVSSSGTVWTVDPNTITNSKLATIATATFKGRTTAGTGNVEDLTSTQATALLNLFTSSLQGLVPASGGGTTTFLRADGTFASVSATIPAGTGILDFGTSGNDTTSVIITDASVSTTSKITTSIYYNSSLSLGRDIEELFADPISIVAVPGTGSLTVYGAALNGTAVGKYGVSYTVA